MRHVPLSLYLPYLPLSSQDSRCAKFWSVPISFLVTCLSITVEVYWLLCCSTPFTDQWMDSVATAALSGQPAWDPYT